jgi:O-antigen/teichoic acid export membrane protein
LAFALPSAGLVFGLQVLLARLMPAETYGGYVSLWTWMLALGSFAALGFAESSVRFLPRYHLRGRRAALNAYWQFGLRVVLGTSMAGGIAGVVLATSHGADGVWLTVLLLAIGLPFLGLEYYLEGVARSFGWFRLAAVPVYILRPLLIGGSALSLWAFGVELSLPLIGALLLSARWQW